jgi:type III restriction enzyme
MSNPFFDRPIVNSPYECPRQHWELDEAGMPTGHLIEKRRRAEFVTPIPKPKKRRAAKQEELGLDEGRGLSSKRQAYDLISIINEVRQNVDAWRALAPSQWQVTPETARLLQHWRHHEFGGVRPFFCQVEAVETAIWLTEVAPHLGAGKRLLEFRAVAVLACDDDVLPLQSRIEGVGDEGDLQETYDTERQLLYVACTRARDRLFVSGVLTRTEY